MRQDAKALLEKLSRQDFQYRQFEDQYADMELWPIFEALLKDPRIVPPRKTPLEHRQAIRADIADRPVAAPIRTDPAATNIFASYGEADALQSQSRRQRHGDGAGDLRSFLSGLSK
tara:strand:- start:10483 stop:10830 length:348 start_codon:yes stop_codon:yes gene_type:complete